uniref:Uncharacterized protein n=1 Tax=Anopheles coluzzii TaxID=1518534 RepID=A0A8W7PB28_ANOCL
LASHLAGQQRDKSCSAAQQYTTTNHYHHHHTPPISDGMNMKKFMTTTKTPAAVATVAGSSPSPPAAFVCETMPLQGAVRNGSPASSERTEGPATSGPPPTPTPTSTASGQPGAPVDETLVTTQGAANAKGSSSLGRGAPSTVGDTASTSASSSTGVVKMCGYLKKKR